ncbi:MAG TPA: CoA pyrophosphatase [Anaerolineales bacterium]|nr:CoA pyrophosphatase [Anaerolineales bacterium]HRQ92950.1 CoA pyrophosphatase [Anaerolineales bacterium]
MAILNLSEDDIRTRLAARLTDPAIGVMNEGYAVDEPRPAAVLLPLLRQDDEWHLLYILRSVHEGDMHSGQVAFPGGRVEPDDASAAQAALREAQEEINLAPEQVRLLGNLEDFITISSYRVTPVVGVIPWPLKLDAQPGEVQRIFTIPLPWLAEPANREERERIAPNGTPVQVVYFSHYERELLWGITARITLNFLQAMGLA